MKKILFLIFCFINFCEGFTQEIDSAFFVFKDEKAIIIDDYILQLLINKNWYCYKQHNSQGVTSDEYLVGEPVFILMKDHSFEAARGTKGKWGIQEDKLLHLTVSSEHDVNREKIMGGSYVIYNISDNHLVLVKNLTSDLKTKIIFYCKVIEKASYEAVPATSSKPIPPMTEEERKAWQEKRIEEMENMSKEELFWRLREELFMRNIKSSQNLEQLTR